MTRLKLNFIHEFRDRHGKIRRYFRRPGYKRIPLPGAPGSEEFMTAYQIALTGLRQTEIGASKTKPGTVAAAVVSYYNSSAYQSLAIETRRTRRITLERFRAEHGDKRIALLHHNHIDHMVAAKARTPAMARNFLKTIRGFMQHCLAQELRTDDPTQGIKSAKIKTEGFATWTEEQIATFEAHHPIGSRARLAFALLLYTGQRRSDVLKMGRQHVQNGAISVRQQKTGAVLEIPLHSDLQAVIEATPNDHLTFLVTEFGNPFSPAGFTNLFRRWVKAANLPLGISAHGLRKACCRRLAEAGCSASEIMSISGHSSLREVQRYCARADQARMARSAMQSISGAVKKRTTVGKPE
jgi:integrase